ncbi:MULTISPECIES: TrbG/VirB9 family P-type conjugative transfer protein [Candidatus Ichthyocystis]|uniref:TrbG/VirB9 family P-type conjugative transfer protein n=1 Tax=Candidatus Ichthyocystis TaxID=2929841 RepID=UPI000B83C1A0|nr:MULTISPECIES: TrbG/VirB9 family P-type conjugative transfer protein [Ichthyocystis]
MKFHIIILYFVVLLCDGLFIFLPNDAFGTEDKHTKDYYHHCDDYLLRHFHICHSIEKSIGGEDSDPAIAIFNYQEDKTYVVYTHVGIMTNVSFQPDESLIGLFLSDTSRWIHAVSQGKQDLFFKPTQGGLINPITILTNKRRYHVWLVSVDDDNHYWYHRVSWRLLQNGNIGVSGSINEFSSIEVGSASFLNNHGGRVGIENSLTQIDLDHLNFGYSVHSSSPSVPFVPDVVFDDGVHMWIRMPDGVKDWPALFVSDIDGKFSVDEYVIKGRYYKVAHVHYCVLLKLGDKIVRMCKRRPTSLRKIIHNIFHPSLLNRYL